MTTQSSSKPRKVNAKRDRIIHVKPIDNKGAVCMDHQNCAIARAILRETGAAWVDVSVSTVLIRRRGMRRLERYLLDSMAREQVRYFDTKGNFAPCRIILAAPPKPTGKRTGARAGSGPSGRHNKSLATR